MKPKTAFAIVLCLVITGEAIADFFARNFSTFVGLAIVAFAVLLISTIRKSQNSSNQKDTFN